MNNARGLRRGGAAFDRPSAAFFRAGGEIGDEVEQRIALPYQAVQPRLFQPQSLEIFQPLSVIKLRQFFFNARRDNHGLGVFCRRFFRDFGRQTIAAFGAVFFDIADINHRLRGDELQVFPVARAVFRNIGFARRTAFAQFGQRQFHQFQFSQRLFVFGGGFFA